MQNIVKIKGEVKTCELCGKEAELRPYGPDGKWICFDCGMKDEDECKRQIEKLLYNADLVIIGGAKESEE